MDNGSLDFYATIGKRITTARKRCELRQADLAERLNVSRAAVANIEAGQQMISIDRLIEIADALDLSPIDLVPELSAPPKTATDPEAATRELEEISAHLDEVERAWVLKIVEASDSNIGDRDPA